MKRLRPAARGAGDGDALRIDILHRCEEVHRPDAVPQLQLEDLRPDGGPSRRWPSRHSRPCHTRRQSPPCGRRWRIVSAYPAGTGRSRPGRSSGRAGTAPPANGPVPFVGRVQVARDEHARQALKRHVLDAVAVVHALAVNDRVQRAFLRQRPKLGPAKNPLANPLRLLLPLRTASNTSRRIWRAALSPAPRVW